MLTYDEALAIATAWVADRAPEAPGRELVILDGHIEETKRGWAFPYSTKRFAETQNPLDGLLGQGPVFVDRETGEVHALGSARIRAWLQAYDRTGSPPPDIRRGWRSDRPGQAAPASADQAVAGNEIDPVTGVRNITGQEAP